jgi:outer membrane lipoprotein-sorting protein
MVFSRVLRCAVFTAAVAFVASNLAGAETAASIKAKLAAASSGIKDIQGVMVVKPASRANAGEINKGVLQFLDQGFSEAKISYKRPDKFRAEGKAKGVDVSYVVNGNTKQIIAPALMLKKNEDLEHARDKKQSTLDVGFASDLLWNDNKVTLLSTDPKGVAKLQLVPIGSKDKRKELIWLDTKSLKVLKRERYGGGGNLKSRHIYSDHKMMAGMPVATLLKAYAPDGGYAGSISYKSVRFNTGLPDSVFAIK